MDQLVEPDEERGQHHIDAVDGGDGAGHPGLFAHVYRQGGAGREARAGEAEAEAGDRIAAHHGPVVGRKRNDHIAHCRHGDTPAQQLARGHLEHADDAPLGEQAGHGAEHHGDGDEALGRGGRQGQLVDDQEAQRLTLGRLAGGDQEAIDQERRDPRIAPHGRFLDPGIGLSDLGLGVGARPGLTGEGALGQVAIDDEQHHRRDHGEAEQRP